MNKGYWGIYGENLMIVFACLIMLMGVVAVGWLIYLFIQIAGVFAGLTLTIIGLVLGGTAVVSHIQHARQ